MAIITGGLYYPEFLFSKSDHINRLDILSVSVDILSGVYYMATFARPKVVILSGVHCTYAF